MTDRNNPFKYHKADRKGYQQMPEEIFQYPELEVLSLAENQLTTLDERIGQFSKLYTLDLSYNQIKKLPKSFAQLQKLEYLMLSSNQFAQFPEVLFQLPNLRFVYFMNNQLTQIPAGIGQWQQLEVLDLGSNKLEVLPATFAQLKQLERLNLTFNQFSSFPKELCSLPKLRALRLKRNQITQLPEKIGQLTSLQALDLGFNPLKDLPKSMEQLKELKELVTTSNQFEAFPEALLKLPQLNNLSALDLDFRLGIKTKMLQSLFSVLKRIKTPQGDKSLQKAAFALLFNKNTEQLTPTKVLPLLSIANKVLQEKLQQFLTQSSPLPTANSSLFLLGKATLLTEAVQANIPWAASLAQATHVILGKNIKKKRLQELPASAVFLSELQVQQHYQSTHSLAWLKENKKEWQELLFSGQGESVLLALQWLEGSGNVEEWATDLLLAYVHLPSKEKKAIKALQKLLLLGLPNFKIQQLPHINFKLYTPEKKETEIAKRIAQCTSPSSYWDGLQVAHYLYQTHQAGYDYLLKNLPTEELKSWLQQFLEGNTLCLSALKELKQFPTFEGDWEAIGRLDLSGCAFIRVPPASLLKQMPNLEEIDLRGNPIRHLPRTRLEELSAYRILLSK